jgi:hypothetical protein
MREIKQRRWGTRVPHRLMEDFRARRCDAAERIALRRCLGHDQKSQEEKSTRSLAAPEDGEQA